MIKYFNIYPVILAAALLSCSFSASAEDFVVIVNKLNPVETLSKSDVKKYFFKDLALWPNGSKVVSVDYKDASALAKNFSMDILGIGLEEKNRKMISNVFSGRSTPPEQKDSEDEVIATVAANKGAIGYVSVSSDTSKVKVIQLK